MVSVPGGRGEEMESQVSAILGLWVLEMAARLSGCHPYPP